MVTATDEEHADARTALLSGSSNNGPTNSSPIILQPHPKTGLVHCLLERTTTTSGRFFSLPVGHHNKVVTLRLEQQQAGAAAAVVLQAQAVAAHRFTISRPTHSDNNNNNNNDNHPTLAPTPGATPLATLVRLQSSMSCITYGLRSGGGVLRAVILYKVPSVSSFLGPSPPPRRAQMAIWHDDPSNKNKNSTAADSDWHWFEAACRDAIRQEGDLLGAALAGVSGVTVCASQEPHRKPNGNIGLNFRGRGRQASPKNMQLTTTATATATATAGGSSKPAPPPVVHAQMAKWDTDRYHLDFLAPPNKNSSGSDSGGMSLLTAFAFGLAQLDL